jgi:hypothetical protein
MRFRSPSFTSGARLFVIAVEIGDSGLSIAEQPSANQVAGELKIRRDGLRLALHSGIVEDEVHLGLDTSKVALDFFERLLAALDIRESPPQDV